MITRFAAAGLMSAALVASLSAQAGTPASSPGILHDITITADEIYTGTMTYDVSAGKVAGTLTIAAPTAITGTVAGTAKDGALALEFPFHMVEQGCDGTVRMRLQLPATPGPVKGTMEAVGCGRDEANKVTGTVELKPVPPKSGAARY